MGNYLRKIYITSNSITIPILDKAIDEHEIDEPNYSYTDNILVFGCRSPESQGIGHWDGAYVFIQHKNGTSVGVVFKNNVDYISNNMSFDDGLKLYSDFLKKEWIPMCNEDIKKTSGVVINN